MILGAGFLSVMRAAADAATAVGVGTPEHNGGAHPSGVGHTSVAWCGHMEVVWRSIDRLKAKQSLHA